LGRGPASHLGVREGVRHLCAADQVGGEGESYTPTRSVYTTRRTPPCRFWAGPFRYDTPSASSLRPGCPDPTIFHSAAPVAFLLCFFLRSRTSVSSSASSPTAPGFLPPPLPRVRLGVLRWSASSSPSMAAEG
jgi:hypothetical protein